MSAPTLLHFSAGPLIRVCSERQSALPLQIKPAGLWVSAGCGDDSWPAWCLAEGFQTDALKHATQIRLRPDARVLFISSTAELDAFDRRHAQPGTPDQCRIFFPRNRVAAEYQGVVIAPYIHERRLSDLVWYYGWDCASGCIWDASAVCELVPRPDLGLSDQGAAPLAERAA